MTLPLEHFKEQYLKKSARDLVIKHIGTDNSREREDISLDMNRRLVEEIKDFNEKSSNQTKWIIGLTISMLIVGLAQIGLFLYPFFAH